MIMEENETKKIKYELDEAVRAKYDHSKTGNFIMYLIVAASIIVFVVTGRGAVSVQLSMGALILGVLQQLWQGFALELFVRDLERKDMKEFDTYPNHISNGAWVFNVLKMTVAIMAAVELILCIS